MIGRSSRRPAETWAGIPIVIVGLSGLAMHHGALGAARSAGRVGIPVFHLHGNGRSAIDSSRYNRGRLQSPRFLSAEQVLEALQQFGREHGEAVLLPVDDVSAVFVDEQCSALGDGFIFPGPPSGLTRRLVNKQTLQLICREHGVPTPEGTFPGSLDELIAGAETLTFPLVLKLVDKSGFGLDANVDGKSNAALTPSVRIAHDLDELIAAYHQARHIGTDVMLQEYIPDSDDANWMFNGYFDAESKCRVSFTGRKIRQSPAFAGAASLGSCEPNREVTETTERFMQAVAYRGIVDIDYRFDRRDNQYKLLDVNPRIGSSFRLFVADDGTDVLRAMYLDITGQPIPAVSSPDRRRWIVELQDLKSALVEVRRGDLSLSAWARSLRHIDETAWWAPDDPRPLLSLSGQVLRNRVAHLLWRVSGHRMHRE